MPPCPLRAQRPPGAVIPRRIVEGDTSPPTPPRRSATDCCRANDFSIERSHCSLTFFGVKRRKTPQTPGGLACRAPGTVGACADSHTALRSVCDGLKAVIPFLAARSHILRSWLLANLWIDCAIPWRGGITLRAAPRQPLASRNTTATTRRSTKLFREKIPSQTCKNHTRNV